MSGSTTTNPFLISISKIVKQLCNCDKMSEEEIFSYIESPSKASEDVQYMYNVARFNKYKLFPKGTKLPGVCAEWVAKSEQLGLLPNEHLRSLTCDGKSSFLNFSVQPVPFFRWLLDEAGGERGGAAPWGHSTEGVGKTCVIEFSSPNIAKPFHAGHLRSTVLGNFLCHGYRALGYQVRSLNYLGDWGKQYGLLAVGFKMFGSEEELVKDPIQHLFTVYVRVNKAKEEDATIDERAREVFREMELGNEEYLTLWRRFRQLSIDEYSALYERLNVRFDEFDGESLYSDDMKASLALLEEKGLLVEDQGAKLLKLEDHKKGLGKVLVQKSDGATLYITRDIAAARRRHERFHFDKMIYVVAAQQDLHFKQLFMTLELLGEPWSKDCQHVNFGMVKGMKTRQGNVVFLADILREAQHRMEEKMRENEAKAAEVEDISRTADILGISAVIVQDFNARRIKDYEFDWDRMLAFKGDTGPYLQFAHARLASIVRKTADEIGKPDLPGSDVALLVHAAGDPATPAEGFKEVLKCAVQLSRFPAKVRAATLELEPTVLVEYLMRLSQDISGILEKVHVKGREPELAKARLALFEVARRTLNEGMRILGLIPLDRM